MITSTGYTLIILVLLLEIIRLHAKDTKRDKNFTALDHSNYVKEKRIKALEEISTDKEIEILTLLNHKKQLLEKLNFYEDVKSDYVQNKLSFKTKAKESLKNNVTN